MGVLRPALDAVRRESLAYLGGWLGASILEAGRLAGMWHPDDVVVGGQACNIWEGFLGW